MINKIRNIYSRITCQACATRVASAKTNEHGSPQLNQTYAVGALAEISMGHALMFTADGRTALCICNKRA